MEGKGCQVLVSLDVYIYIYIFALLRLEMHSIDTPLLSGKDSEAIHSTAYATNLIGPSTNIGLHYCIIFLRIMVYVLIFSPVCVVGLSGQGRGAVRRSSADAKK